MSLVGKVCLPIFSSRLDLPSAYFSNFKKLQKQLTNYSLTERDVGIAVLEAVNLFKGADRL